MINMKYDGRAEKHYVKNALRAYLFSTPVLHALVSCPIRLSSDKCTGSQTHKHTHERMHRHTNVQTPTRTCIHSCIYKNYVLAPMCRTREITWERMTHPHTHMQIPPSPVPCRHSSPKPRLIHLPPTVQTKVKLLVTFLSLSVPHTPPTGSISHTTHSKQGRGLRCAIWSIQEWSCSAGVSSRTSDCECDGSCPLLMCRTGYILLWGNLFR